jgi:hypothetical protein
MFDAAWHDEQLAVPQLHRAVAEFDLEFALEHEEEVVGARMAVPNELALDLYHSILYSFIVATMRGEKRSSKSASFRARLTGSFMRRRG